MSIFTIVTWKKLIHFYINIDKCIRNVFDSISCPQTVINEIKKFRQKEYRYVTIYKKIKNDVQIQTCVLIINAF